MEDTDDTTREFPDGGADREAVVAWCPACRAFRDHVGGARDRYVCASCGATLACPDCDEGFTPDHEHGALHRAARVGRFLDQYRRAHLPGEDVEVVATDLVTDLLHALPGPAEASRVLRGAWSHWCAESGVEHFDELPAFADLVASVADFQEWLAQVTDAAGDLRDGVSQAEFDADRTDCWQAIAEAAVTLVRGLPG